MFGAWSALTRFDISFDFSIWFCDACVENRRLGVRRSTYLGLAFGLAAGVVGGLLSYGSLPGWYGFFILGAIVGPLIGWVVGSRRHAPLAKASYNPLKKTVRLRFRHPGYAQLMAAAIDRTQSEDRRE